MSIADIITISLSVAVLVFTIFALFFSAWSYIKKRLEIKILNYFNQINSSYSSFMPESKCFEGTHISNEVTNILIQQGIHGNGIGKFIYYFEGYKWFEQLSIDGISKILKTLSISKLRSLSKYYKIINKRIIESKTIILGLDFFEKSSYSYFYKPVCTGYPWENGQIDRCELILYFSNERDYGQISIGMGNTKLSEKDKYQLYPSNKDPWALKFKNKKNEKPIFVIFEGNTIKNIKIPGYFFREPNYKINNFLSFLKKDIQEKKQPQIDYFQTIIYESDIKDIEATMIIDAAKTYYYIYCALRNLYRDKKPNSLLSDDNEFITMTDFNRQEIFVAKNILKLINDENLVFDWKHSTKIWVLVFLEFIFQANESKI